MQNISATGMNNIPETGYYISSDKDKKAQFYHTESHIYKQGPLSGVKVGAYKFAKNFTTYFPKGFKGSKNSDFHEFLSLGSAASFIGSATLIALYNLANCKFNAQDAKAAGFGGKQFAAGVILYGLAKVITPKIVHTALKHSTGVNLDMYYANKINELPENGEEKGKLRTQYSKVFASKDFYRVDLLTKDSEMNYGNMDAYNEKIARKAGYKGELKASNQIADGKIRDLIARATALDNITKYIVAATGVALGSRAAFGNVQILKPTSKENIKGTFSSIGKALKDGFKQLWTGDNTAHVANKGSKLKQLKNGKLSISGLAENFSKKLGNLKNINIAESLKNLKNINLDTIRKHAGKALIIASAVSMFLNWLIPTVKFKSNPNTMKSEVDKTKEYEVS